MTNQLTPEQQSILEDYSQSCLEQFLARREWNHDRPYDITRYARNNPASWLQNFRESTLQAINKGQDTWERITEVAEKYRNT